MDELKEWLSNPRREYAQGVTLFETLASDEIKKKYLVYFKAIESPGTFDSHFSMLINKLTDINRKIKLNPALIPIVDIIVAPSVLEPVKQKKIIPEKLPEDLLSKYSRIKEIVPLMARIHSELSDTALSDEDRKSKAEELCSLEDEKAELWHEIDTWSGANGVTIESVPTQTAHGESIQEGAKIGLRINQLKENISRSEKAAEKAKAEGKKNLEANANTRLANYRKELADLEAKLKMNDN